MVHYDEAVNSYTLIVRGAKISFPDISSMLEFAQKKYNLNLLTQLN